MHLVTSLHELFAARPHERRLPSWILGIDKRQGVILVRVGPHVDANYGIDGDDPGLSAAVPDGWEHSVVFDFAKTCDVDFATVALLVLALRARVPAHAKIGVLNPPPKLRDLIRISKLQDLLPSFADEDEAVKAFTAKT